MTEITFNFWRCGWCGRPVNGDGSPLQEDLLNIITQCDEDYVDNHPHMQGKVTGYCCNTLNEIEQMYSKEEYVINDDYSYSNYHYKKDTYRFSCNYCLYEWTIECGEVDFLGGNVNDYNYKLLECPRCHHHSSRKL